MYRLKAIRCVYVLLLVSKTNFRHRISIPFKYYPMYVNISKMEQNRFNAALNEHKKANNNDYLKYITTLFSYKKKANESFNKSSKIVNDAINTQFASTKKGFTIKLIQYLSLYYESLQALVEGRREVMNDPKFKFEDGQTVQQKKIAFQKMMTKILKKRNH